MKFIKTVFMASLLCPLFAYSCPSDMTEVRALTLPLSSSSSQDSVVVCEETLPQQSGVHILRSSVLFDGIQASGVSVYSIETSFWTGEIKKWRVTRLVSIPGTQDMLIYSEAPIKIDGALSLANIPKVFRVNNFSLDLNQVISAATSQLFDHHFNLVVKLNNGETIIKNGIEILY